LASFDVVGSLISSAPKALGTWSSLAQDQYFEMRTLLAGYLLSSQGDRMLMAHSVEGRFPFLDPGVVALGASLPPSYKLKVLDEKHVLKQLGRELLPKSILRRTKQPYRAPDALAFLADPSKPPQWLDEVLQEQNVDQAGVFSPKAVAMLWGKCRSTRGAQLSHADNTALVSVISTQLLHHSFILRGARSFAYEPELKTVVDKTTEAQ
jgi:asparagine synthase (glutamine-hydrolysing)